VTAMPESPIKTAQSGFDSLTSTSKSSDRHSTSDTVKSSGGLGNMAINGIKTVLPDATVETKTREIAKDPKEIKESKLTQKLNTEPDSKFILGYFISPESSFRKLTTTNTTTNVVTERNNNEKPKIALSTGISLHYKLSEKFLLGTGIYFMSIGEKGKYYTDSLKTDLKAYSNSYNYIGLPVLIGYKIGRNRMSATINSGIILNKLLRSSSTNNGDSYYNNQQDVDQSGNSQNNQDESTVNNPRPQYSSFNLVYTGSIEINYQLYRRLSMHVGPSVKYFLSSIYDQEEIQKAKPYSLGLQIGLKYRF
jgi:hypothetical protein